MRLWRAAVVLGLAAVIARIGLACTGFGASETVVTDAGIEAAAETEAEAAASPEDSSTPPVDDGGCNSSMPFVRLDSIGNVVNTSSGEGTPRLRTDELVLYVTKSTPAGNVWIQRYERASREEAWVNKGIVGANLFNRRDLWPTADPKRLYFAQYEEQSDQSWHLVREILDDAGLAFGTYLPLRADNLHDVAPFVTPDESELWFGSTRSGGGGLTPWNIYRARRNDAGEYENPAPVDELNTTGDEIDAVLSSDLHTAYISSTRERGPKQFSIWMATRGPGAERFSDVRKVPGLESLSAGTFSARVGWVSPDECRLYVTTTKDDGSEDVYVASRR